MVEKFLENGAIVFLLSYKKENVDNAISELKAINDNYEVENRINLYNRHQPSGCRYPASKFAVNGAARN